MFVYIYIYIYIFIIFPEEVYGILGGLGSSDSRPGSCSDVARCAQAARSHVASPGVKIRDLRIRRAEALDWKPVHKGLYLQLLLR